MGQSYVEDELASFTWFFSAEYPQLVRLLRVVVRDVGGAEDLAQEAFVRLHGNWAQVSGYDNPEAWVRRVALNLAFSWRRREGRRLSLERSAERWPRPDLAEPELHLEVHRAVAALPPRQRALVALYHLEDRPVAEVAEVLGMSPSAVKVGLHRARARLAEILGSEEVSR